MVAPKILILLVPTLVLAQITTYPQGGGGGGSESTVVANSGATGASVLKTGTNVVGRKIKAGSNVTIVEGVDDVEISSSAVGGGITTLGGQTGNTQGFSSVNDTNIGLGITSAANTHTFTMNWSGALTKVRQHAATLYDDQTYADPTWLTSLAWAKLTGVPSTFTPSTHNHAGADINSGTIGTARLGSGTPSASTFLRGDQTWATPAGSGDFVGPASSINNRLVLFDGTTGKLGKQGLCSSDPTTGELTCGDGTLPSMVKLPELAVNGTSAVYLYGAVSQSADTCMVLPANGNSTTGQIMKDLGSITIDGRTCRSWGFAADDIGGGGGTLKLDHPFLIGVRHGTAGYNVPAVNTSGGTELQCLDVNGSGSPNCLWGYPFPDENAVQVFSFGIAFPSDYAGGTVTLDLMDRQGGTSTGVIGLRVRLVCVATTNTVTNTSAGTGASNTDQLISLTVPATSCTAGKPGLFYVDRPTGDGNTDQQSIWWARVRVQ